MQPMPLGGDNSYMPNYSMGMIPHPSQPNGMYNYPPPSGQQPQNYMAGIPPADNMFMGGMSQPIADHACVRVLADRGTVIGEFSYGTLSQLWKKAAFLVKQQGPDVVLETKIPEKHLAAIVKCCEDLEWKELTVPEHPLPQNKIEDNAISR